jgi:hypothetical protein
MNRAPVLPICGDSQFSPAEFDGQNRHQTTKWGWGGPQAGFNLAECVRGEAMHRAVRTVFFGILGVAAVLVAASVIHNGFARNHVADGSNQLVANVPLKERHMLKLVDVAGCHDEVVAGQEAKLSASSSRIARQELASREDIVIGYCKCRFSKAKSFMTEREMVTQWLSASAALSDPLPSDTRAKLDQVVEDCAGKYGLRT